ncbi:alanine--tRNA ligase, cytoplasmic-like [Babylonia areolata]|uniref:alanine--tRNA ligase, cytoplasmic-like n=1 Tax=Babylonia areolata TaxID=304850 RepID=UPI003FD0FB03
MITQSGRMLTHCIKVRLCRQAFFHVRSKSTRTAAGKAWSSSETRSAFLRYFQEQDHLFVPSSSVIPNKLQGTYFTNAGMNQFKPLFLGTVDPKSTMASYKRVANSQKCIRVGGKHNDLEEVGHDLTHHTFFEMLGNWSFGDYFKEPACKMALEMLTSVYMIPVDRLYFTYFGGDQQLNLQPDMECVDIWRSLGIPAERILPFGMKDNFWDMGDTGPCGPCTEIHFDHVGGRSVPEFVNADNPEVVEIWNLVFMQYQRHEDGSLSQLPLRHVDTGMGLERLIAVLNGTRSNYDSDLFQPLFSAIQKASGAEAYRGRVGQADPKGIDTAYRVLADHARMYTVAIADGLMPSKNGLGHKLRQLMYRCVRLSQNTFGTNPQLLCELVDHVAASLGEAFPEIPNKSDVVKSAVALTVEGYLQLQKESRQSFARLLRQTNTKHLTGEVVWQLNEGRYGCSVPVDMIVDLAEEHGVTVDLQGFQQRLQQFKDCQSHAPLMAEGLLSRQCYERLQQAGAASTDDSYKYLYSASPSGYDFSEGSSEDCLVRGLIQHQEVTASVQQGAQAVVLLDKTCFYARGGGQIADVGTLVSENGEFVVEDVQVFNDCVLHLGKQVSGTLSVGDHVQPVIAQGERLGCMRNHTATHLLQAVLRQHLGGSVQQQGSSVRPDRLSFDFLCLEKLSNEKLQEIEHSIQQLISQRHAVHRRRMTLQEALDCEEVVVVPNEEYPSEVTLVQIGDVDEAVSRELCGGTHVLNTGDIEDFCITRVSSVSQGVRRIFAVTGAQATEVHEKGAHLNALCEEFSALVASQSSTAAEMSEKSQEIRQMLKADVLPHTARDRASSLVETMAQYVTAAANRESQSLMLQAVEDVVRRNAERPFVVHTMKFEGKQMVRAVSSLQVNTPVGLVSTERKSGVVVLVWPPNQALGDVESALTATLGTCAKVMRSSVNKGGARVIQVTVRGSRLSDWLESSVRDTVQHLLSR